MKNTLSLLIAGFTLAAIQAGAQTSTSTSTTTSTTTSTSKIGDLQKPTEKMKDIDEEITDARMRATLGSKSRWSFKSTLNYSGGSIREPLATVRPAYRTGTEDQSLATLSGTVGVNVRATDKDNISFGTGITVVDPLHGDITKNAKDETALGGGQEVARYRIATPYVGWSRGYKAFDAQMMSSATVGYYTADTTISRGYYGYISLGQTVLANFGKSGWNGGVSFSLNKEFYGNPVTNKAYEAALSSGKAFRDEWSGGAYPFMQYTFNDRYSFRTVFGYAEFQQKEKTSDIKQVEPYQSVGIGISITRDIYLYPNVQFTPKDIRDDRTNVALSTNINLF